MRISRNRIDLEGGRIDNAVGLRSEGHIFGLTLSNNATDATNDIDIATGSCRSDDDTRDIILSSSLTKRLDAAWAVGTNQGGLDTGAIADTTYHVFLIMRTDTGVVDALFSTSASSPTMPTNYDKKRRVGSIRRASGAIVTFSQNGDEFLVTPVNQVEVSNPGTSAQTATLSVPLGIVVWALVTMRFTETAIREGILTSLSQADVAPSGTVHDVHTASSATSGSVYKAVRTNTSGQIRYRLNGDGDIWIILFGWIDHRGRLL